MSRTIDCKPGHWLHRLFHVELKTLRKNQKDCLWRLRIYVNLPYLGSKITKLVGYQMNASASMTEKPLFLYVLEITNLRNFYAITPIQHF